MSQPTNKSIWERINNISYKLGLTKYWWIHTVILVVLALLAIALCILFPWILLLPLGYFLYTIIRDKIRTNTTHYIYDDAKNTLTQVNKNEYENTIKKSGANSWKGKITHKLE